MSLFRGINLDLATCLRPFRTGDSSSGGKDGSVSLQSSHPSLAFSLILHRVVFESRLFFLLTHSGVCFNDILVLKN